MSAGAACQNHFREDHPEWTSLPGVFLRAGADALGAGKLYHPKLPPEYDGNRSWSDAALPWRNPCWNTADHPDKFPKFQDGGLPCLPCLTDVEHYIFHANSTVANDWCEHDAFEDTLSVELALRQLRAAAGAGRQFYLAVGVHKPHLPWQASAADFAAHPLADVEPARFRVPPAGVPGIALQDSDSKDPFTPLPNASARAARRAYRAAITGADRKLGVLLDELDALGIANATAVVAHRSPPRPNPWPALPPACARCGLADARLPGLQLRPWTHAPPFECAPPHSDHGYQMGEHSQWRKFSSSKSRTRNHSWPRAPCLLIRRLTVRFAPRCRFTNFEIACRAQ